RRSIDEALDAANAELHRSRVCRYAALLWSLLGSRYLRSTEEGTGQGLRRNPKRICCSVNRRQGRGHRLGLWRLIHFRGRSQLRVSHSGARRSNPSPTLGSGRGWRPARKRRSPGEGLASTRSWIPSPSPSLRDESPPDEARERDSQLPPPCVPPPWVLGRSA